MGAGLADPIDLVVARRDLLPIDLDVLGQDTAEQRVSRWAFGSLVPRGVSMVTGT
jgi:hypothetical protein